MPTVEVPEGTVDFPDSMSQSEIESALNEHYSGISEAKKKLSDEMAKVRRERFLTDQEQAAIGAAQNIAKVAAIPATPILKLPRSEGTGVGAGLLNLGAGAAEGISAPAYWMLPASRPLQALVAGQTAGGIPESAVNAIKTLTNPDATKAQKVEAVGNPILQAAVATAITKGANAANKVKGTSGLPPEQQGVPLERPTEGQAEAGTPQRGGEGEQPLPQPAEVQKEVALKELKEEGVTEDNAKSLLEGSKQPHQVVDEQLKIRTSYGSPDSPHLIIDENPDGTRTAAIAPEAGPSRMTPKNIGQMPHDVALEMARQQGIERINSILEKRGVIPKRPSPEEEFRRIDEEQNRLEGERLRPKVPSTGESGKAQPSAGPIGATVETPVPAGETPQAMPETATPEQPKQVGSVTQHVTEPISKGPGAASPGDIPNAPRIAQASTAPIERPFGNVSSFSVALNNIHDALANIGSTIKGIAGESLPRITKSDREVGEAGVRYASSRIAAKPIAQTFATKALQGTDVDPIKFGAALVEDNLRSIRESLRQDATKELADGHEANARDLSEKADRVATMIGAKNSPFQTEEAYLDYLQEPNVKQAVKQHIQLWDEVVDPQFKAAMNIDPDIELPSRGQQTGARVNLRAVFPEDPASNPIRGVVGSNLTGTFRRKSPFGAQAKGTGETYDINYGNLIQNTFERQLEIANKNKFDNMLVNKGLAVIDSPGKQVMIDGKPAVGFPLSRRVLIIPKKGEPTTALSQAKNIYVRSDLANEYEGAAGVGSKWRTNWFTKVANVINRAALSGLTDATVHVSNQLTALLDRPTSGKLLTDSLLSATGRADALVTVVRGIAKAFQDNREQISQLSEIGAMRPQDIHFGLFGRALQKTDQVTRLLLDDTFKRLVDSGLVENTETARREYVNQIGQYNRRLQGKITRLFRDTGIGPFVTAGKTFNSLGVRIATLNPGAKGSNLFAAAALRANILSKWVGASVLLGTLNYLMTHKKGGGVLGRPGTPIGNLDLGTNDKSGKQQSFPLFSVLGLGRALRVTGASGAINAKRLGLPNADAAESASRDIINAWSAPFAGPPVKFGAIAATGYSPAVEVGRTSRIVPPGDNQRLENVKEALRQASPVVQSYLKYRSNKPISEVLSSQVPRFTMTPGKTESMVEKYPKIVSMAQGNAFIDDMIGQARKLPKEERRKFVNEQVMRLPPEQRAHGRNEAVRRRVYTN